MKTQGLRRLHSVTFGVTNVRGPKETRKHLNRHLERPGGFRRQTNRQFSHPFARDCLSATDRVIYLLSQRSKCQAFFNVSFLYFILRFCNLSAQLLRLSKISCRNESPFNNYCDSGTVISNLGGHSISTARCCSSCSGSRHSEESRVKPICKRRDKAAAKHQNGNGNS